jgi:dCTP deaminase
MSLITYNGLVDLVKSGMIENVEPGQINGASIDIRLGDSLLFEDTQRTSPVDLAGKQTPNMLPAPLAYMDDSAIGKAWMLWPGQFALANTVEVFHLPDDVAFEYKLKSSLARAGLEHSLAGWADPGWNNATLTLELRNVLTHHPLILRPGMRIGQIVCWRGESVPENRSYRNVGRYNHQRAATESKGV